MYLKTVDKFNEYSINCMITPGSKIKFENIYFKNVWLYYNTKGMRFLFIHEGKSEDNIKNFFQDVYEYYVKVNWIKNGILYYYFKLSCS